VLAKRIGYAFEHHNALEDAKAAGQIMLAAMRDTDIDLEGWFERVAKPINPKAVKSIRREGTPEGPLFGEIVVFTGALQVSRREAADLAAAAGCEVEKNVTKKTTLLVVGDVDVAKMAGHDKSSKHRKAESLMARGQAIRIIQETDFVNLLAVDGA